MCVLAWGGGGDAAEPCDDGAGRDALLRGGPPLHPHSPQVRPPATPPPACGRPPPPPTPNPLPALYLPCSPSVTVIVSVRLSRVVRDRPKCSRGVIETNPPPHPSMERARNETSLAFSRCALMLAGGGLGRRSTPVWIQIHHRQGSIPAGQLRLGTRDSDLMPAGQKRLAAWGSDLIPAGQLGFGAWDEDAVPAGQ